MRYAIFTDIHANLEALEAVSATFVWKKAKNPVVSTKCAKKL